MSNKSFVDKRITRTKKLLQDALLKLLENKDIKDISISEITKKADVNRGSFYNNYEYKEDILNELIDKIIEDLIYSYRYPYKDLNEFQTSNIDTIKIFKHVANHKKFYKMIAMTDLNDFNNKFSNQIKSLILTDVSIKNPNPKINIQYNARFIAEGIKGLIFEWIESDFKYSADYMAEQLTEIISDDMNKVYIINKKI